MRKFLLFLVFLTSLASGCILFALATVPPPGVAYIRDPEVLPNEPDWKDPRHIMLINNTMFYVKVRINGRQIVFREFIRKMPDTFYLAPRRTANLLHSREDDLKITKVTRSGWEYTISDPGPIRIEYQGFLAPDFSTPLVKGEKVIKINWHRHCQKVELDF